MQGQLRGEYLSARIDTECVHCHQPLHIELDSELKVSLVEPNTEPLVSLPDVDFEALEDPSIIDAF